MRHEQYLFLRVNKFGIAVISHPGYPVTEAMRNETPKNPKNAAPPIPNETKEVPIRLKLNASCLVNRYVATIPIVRAIKINPTGR